MDPHTLCKKVVTLFHEIYIVHIYSFTLSRNFYFFICKFVDRVKCQNAGSGLGRVRCYFITEFLSVARQVSANFSADRKQEEMQKVTYLRAAIASVLAYSL